MAYAIRKAGQQDLPRMNEIYAAARQFMRNSGNHMQWGEGDRPEDLLEEDIRQGELYVLTEETEGKEVIHAVFVFADGPDPSYAEIENGRWLSDEAYAVVHRVASDGTVHNVLGQIMEYCKARVPHLRIDTHEDNAVMQHVIEKCGFKRCGIIYVSNGTPRIAYEWITG